MHAAFFFFLSLENGAYMLDFSLPADFGGVAADLDFSLSDVAIQSRDDGIGNERYLRPKRGQNRKKKNKKKTQAGLFDDLPF